MPQDGDTLGDGLGEIAGNGVGDGPLGVGEVVDGSRDRDTTTVMVLPASTDRPLSGACSITMPSGCAVSIRRILDSKPRSASLANALPSGSPIRSGTGRESGSA